MKRFAVVSTLAFLAACANHEERERTGARADAIVAGWDATWGSAVVALVDERRSARCTATVVSSRAVLTAAHCQTSGAKAVAFGNDLATARVVPIASFVAHPRFDPASLSNDIALVALADPAPASAEIATLGKDVARDRVVVMGYGIDAAGTPGRRGGLATVAGVDALTFHTTPAPSQPCRGDSGGPALLQTELATIVVGVVSSGDAKCAAQTTYSRVDAYLAGFLESTIPQLAEGASRLGQRCFHDESCADGGTCFAPPSAPTKKYCTTSCAADAECPASMRCNAGACELHVLPGASGSSCTTDEDL